MMNELTFSSREHKDIKLQPFYSDDRGSAGTASWWIFNVARSGFELLSYETSSYVFRKLWEA